MTTTVRISEDALAHAKQIAALRGEQAGEALARAWWEWMENHRDEIAADFEKAAKLIRKGDKEGLAAHASRFVDERAAAAAEAARGQP